jgi:hypothetical protein
MSRSGFALNTSLLIAVIALAMPNLGCGAMNSSQNRVLQSIAVTPASADAQSFSMGQVPFTATGTYSEPPSPAPVSFVAPYSGGWMVSDTRIATISQSGMAQCIAGATGTVTVTAKASANSGTGTQNISVAVSGTATLKCP